MPGWPVGLAFAGPARFRWRRSPAASSPDASGCDSQGGWGLAVTATARLTKQTCAALRGELRDLGSGQPERGTTEVFARWLYPVPEHLRALDPSVVLVVGPCGAGKSVLFRAFFSGDEELAAAIRASAPRGLTARQATPRASDWRRGHPAETDFPDSAALAQVIDSDEKAKALWNLMLARRLADELSDAQRRQLEPLLRPKAAECGALFAAAASLDAAPMTALDALDKTLEREGRQIFIGYDELDSLGGSDWALMARLVRGLVASWSDNSRRWRRIRAKIFLRSDLLRRQATLGSADFARLAANRAEVAWSDAALLGMTSPKLTLVRRLISG